MQFKFLVYEAARDEWTVAKDWSISPTFDWVPSRAGHHAVQALVRPAGSTAAFTDAITSPTFAVSAATANLPAWIALDRLSPLSAAQPVTVSAGPTVPGDFEYRFTLVWETFFTTTVLQDWSRSATTVWRPLTPGTYRVQVTLRRAGSPTAVATVATQTVIVQ